MTVPDKISADYTLRPGAAARPRRFPRHPLAQRRRPRALGAPGLPPYLQGLVTR